jgi:cation/acetate symporter
MPRQWIGYLFMFATIVLYATHRRGEPHLQRAPNTMWRDAACRPCSTAWPPPPTGYRPPASSAWRARLYLHGFDGLAYIMGWTGGYCLVALLIAPYLRKFSQYTIPDFLAARYGGADNATPGADARCACWP